MTIGSKVKVVASQAEITALIVDVGPERWFRGQKDALTRIHQDRTLAGAWAEIDGVIYYTADSASGQKMLARIASGEFEAQP